MAEPIKPTHVPNVSQAELWLHYKQHDFASKLSRCEQIVLVDGPRKSEDTYHSELTETERGIKYIDPDTKHSVAVIFTYTNIVGEESTTIRMLRIGDIIYDARVRTF